MTDLNLLRELNEFQIKNDKTVDYIIYTRIY